MSMVDAPSETLRVLGPAVPDAARVLTPPALRFVGDLVRRFRNPVSRLRAQRRARYEEFADGVLPRFAPETEELRRSDWEIAPIPPALLDRRVEITGPAHRKMVIQALNSGAQAYMCDLEDSTSPTWVNLIEGQANLIDAIRRAITYEDPATGRAYALNREIATLLVRPRGWHLDEDHCLLHGRVVPASLVDVGLFLYHNAHELVRTGRGPYLYLPKLESHLEARLWNDVFLYAQQVLGLPAGTIKATVLIETLPAVFEMHEILYELRQHIAGLNCGRWDYIFSAIKTRQSDASFVLPDRNRLGMDAPFLRAYSRLLIQTCHQRGALAIGGMAAQIPIKNDPAANDAALERVRNDKLREVRDGHDGTWVAHPSLVPIAQEIFTSGMAGEPNQLDRQLTDSITADKLLASPGGQPTEAGLRGNVSVALQYIEAWLGGVGCLAINNLMEDAATAEICRTQIWQWLAHGAALDDGRLISRRLVRDVVDEEVAALRGAVRGAPRAMPHLDEARQVFDDVATAARLEPFLTSRAYKQLVKYEPV